MMDCKRCGNYSHGGTDGSDLCDLCARSDYNKEILSLRAELSEANAKLCGVRELLVKTDCPACKGRGAIISYGKEVKCRSCHGGKLWGSIDHEDLEIALSSTGPCRHEHHIAAHCPKPGHFSSPVEHGCKMCMDASEDEKKQLREAVVDVDSIAKVIKNETNLLDDWRDSSEALARAVVDYFHRRAFGESPTGEGKEEGRVNLQGEGRTG